MFFILIKLERILSKDFLQKNNFLLRSLSPNLEIPLPVLLQEHSIQKLSINLTDLVQALNSTKNAKFNPMTNSAICTMKALRIRIILQGVDKPDENSLRDFIKSVLKDIV